MTIGHGIGLLLIGLVTSFLVLWGLLKAQEIFDKQREKDENTTTRDY